MQNAKLISGLVLAFIVCTTGCRSIPEDLRPPAVARFLIEADSARGALEVTLPVSGVQLRVASKPVITEFDLVRVSEAQVDLGRCVLFQLSVAAARDLYRLTVGNLGRRLVLVVNGQALGARVIDRPLDEGMLFIFLEVPDSTLRALVEDLNATTNKIQQEAAKL